MRIALAQIYCPWGEIDASLRRHHGHIRDAARHGAELVAFPETSVPGMYKNHLIRLCAEPLDGPTVERMSAWARRYGIAVAFGIAEKTAGKPYNTYVLVDRTGSLVGAYRKNYVTNLELEYFRRDTRRPVFELHGYRVAVSICADHCAPELASSYGRRGAQLVLFPHAWDADPVLKNGRIAGWKNEQDMVDHYDRGLVARYRNHNEMLAYFRPRISALAEENGFHGVFVNQTGTPHPLIPFVGPAFAVNPRGQLLAATRGKGETLLITECDLE
ncbi:MAG: carbon-nitrogen hydrolase family protein [Gemmatimonadetes bacterium]|nr:carbon-nitrogen hydrolase family protein [Gemmatimonadota bacterium]MBT7861622.1 carbon-nitrogen hydrolase family protein [Gemmatimonadota bacterium]